MKQRLRAFDDRLEALVADATPEQLSRIRDLAALQLRIVERQRAQQQKQREKQEKLA